MIQIANFDNNYDGDDRHFENGFISISAGRQSYDFDDILVCITYVYLDFEKSDDEKYKFANTKWQTAAMLKTFLVIAYLGGIVQLRQSVEWGSRITHMGRSPHDPIVKFRKFKIADGDHFDSG